MVIEVSGEVLRLLSILAGRPNGATQHELTILNGVNTSLIYRAVVLALVQAQSDKEMTYRYHLSDAGRKLLAPES